VITTNLLSGFKIRKATFGLSSVIGLIVFRMYSASVWAIFADLLLLLLVLVLVLVIPNLLVLVLVLVIPNLLVLVLLDLPYLLERVGISTNTQCLPHSAS
jgi:hypothetical protein